MPGTTTLRSKPASAACATLSVRTLTAEVSGLRRDIQESDQRAADSNRRADEHRTVVHRRVDELVAEVGGVKTDLVTVKRDLSDAKAVTEEVKRWKLMGLGALGVTGIAAGAIGSAVTYFWSDLLRLLRG